MTGKQRVKVLDESNTLRPALGKNDRVTLGTTEKGKDIVIEPIEGSVYRIKFANGGETPRMFDGTFSFLGAQRVVEEYLKQKGE